MVKDLINSTCFNHMPVLHDGHTVGNIGHNAKIMGDEKHTCLVHSLHVANQFQDLGLSCHIKRRCWFIGNKNFWLKRQRHSNHRPLALPTRQLMGIGVNDLSGVRQLHVVQQLYSPLAPFSCGHGYVIAKNLVDLAADGHDRV